MQLRVWALDLGSAHFFSGLGKITLFLCPLAFFPESGEKNMMMDMNETPRIMPSIQLNTLR